MIPFWAEAGSRRTTPPVLTVAELYFARADATIRLVGSYCWRLNLCLTEIVIVLAGFLQDWVLVRWLEYCMRLVRETKLGMHCVPRLKRGARSYAIGLVKLVNKHRIGWIVAAMC